MFNFLLKRNNSYDSFVYIEKYLSEDKIKNIKQKYNCKEKMQADIENNRINKNIRNALKTSISYDKESEWLYFMLEDTAKHINNKYYNYDLIGFEENVQLLTYNVGGKYESHRDFGSGSISNRKLSMVIILDDNYEGGQLEIFNGKTWVKTPSSKGDLIVFPSFEWHRVKEVTKGTRNSLVAWVTGPTFR